MTVTKRLNVHQKPELKKHALLIGKLAPVDTMFPAGSSRQEQLEPVKNIAELWLQADLDNSTDRKAHLEDKLADALESLEQDFTLPVCEIFKKVLCNSKLRPM